jgi:hypothetical protein
MAAKKKAKVKKALKKKGALAKKTFTPSTPILKK